MHKEVGLADALSWRNLLASRVAAIVRVAAMALSSRGVRVLLLLHMAGRGAGFPGRPARFSAPPPSASADPSAAAEPQEEEVLRSNAYPLRSNAYP